MMGGIIKAVPKLLRILIFVIMFFGGAYIFVVLSTPVLMSEGQLAPLTKTKTLHRASPDLPVER